MSDLPPYFPSFNEDGFPQDTNLPTNLGIVQCPNLQETHVDTEDVISQHMPCLDQGEYVVMEGANHILVYFSPLIFPVEEVDDCTI